MGSYSSDHIAKDLIQADITCTTVKPYRSTGLERSVIDFLGVLSSFTGSKPTLALCLCSGSKHYKIGLTHKNGISRVSAYVLDFN